MVVNVCYGVTIYKTGTSMAVEHSKQKKVIQNNNSDCLTSIRVAYTRIVHHLLRGDYI